MSDPRPDNSDTGLRILLSSIGTISGLVAGVFLIPIGFAVCSVIAHRFSTPVPGVIISVLTTPVLYCVGILVRDLFWRNRTVDAEDVPGGGENLFAWILCTVVPGLLAYTGFRAFSKGGNGTALELWDLLLITAGVSLLLSMLRGGAVYFRPALKPKRALLIASIPCWVLLAAGGYFTYRALTHADGIVAMRSAEGQEGRLHEQMTEDVDKYGKDLQSIAAPLSAIRVYADGLRRIDTSRCPPDYREAFQDFRDAWRDFGDSVEKHSGLLGLIQSALSGGGSLIEAILVKFPTNVLKIEDAKKRMKAARDRESDKSWKDW